jgi:hypothetical protein
MPRWKNPATSAKICVFLDAPFVKQYNPVKINVMFLFNHGLQFGWSRNIRFRIYAWLPIPIVGPFTKTSSRANFLTQVRLVFQMWFGSPLAGACELNWGDRLPHPAAYLITSLKADEWSISTGTGQDYTIHCISSGWNDRSPSACAMIRRILELDRGLWGRHFKS